MRGLFMEYVVLGTIAIALIGVPYYLWKTFFDVIVMQDLFGILFVCTCFHTIIREYSIDLREKDKVWQQNNPE